MLPIRRKTARRRVNTPREARLIDEIKRLQNIIKTDRKNQRDWKEFYHKAQTIYISLSMMETQQPYNSNLFEGKDRFFRFINYQQIMIKFIKDIAIEAGLTTIEKETLYLQNIIKYNEKWLEKQPKKVQKEYEGYLDVYKYELQSYIEEISKFDEELD